MPPESPVFGCLPHLCSPLIVIFQSPLSSVRTTEEAVGRNDGYTNGGELHSYLCCSVQSLGFLLVFGGVRFLAIVAVAGWQARVV